MAFLKQTIKDVDVKNKRVLMRVDYNVPLEGGRVVSDYRMTESLPTIKYLIGRGCSLVLLSHLGRPDGKVNKEFSLEPVAKHLAQLLKRPVGFTDDCLGPKTAALVKNLKPGDVLLLENVRFYPEEEANNQEFAKKLASYGEIFVQDAFGVVHHGAVSVSELPKYLPSYAGLLLEKEIEAISTVVASPKRPLVALIGGAKIADKIRVIEKFIESADAIAIGGAMANTFLLAEGIEVGRSLTDKDDLSLARDILDKAKAEARKRPFIFYLPHDGVVATNIEAPKSTRIVDWSAHVIADIESYPTQPKHQASQVAADELILDIGPFSGSFIAGLCQLAATVVWNGTMGVTEVSGLSNDPIGPFAHGTELVVEALSGQFGNRPYSLVGGGDTVSYVEQRRLTKIFNHVSTGGGASLELMEGKKLPGIEALLDKNVAKSSTIKHKQE